MAADQKRPGSELLDLSCSLMLLLGLLQLKISHGIRQRGFEAFAIGQGFVERDHVDLACVLLADRFALAEGVHARVVDPGVRTPLSTQVAAGADAAGAADCGAAPVVLACVDVDAAGAVPAAVKTN
jgi:hypothetical protein